MRLFLNLLLPSALLLLVVTPLRAEDAAPAMAPTVDETPPQVTFEPPTAPLDLEAASPESGVATSPPPTSSDELDDKEEVAQPSPQVEPEETLQAATEPSSAPATSEAHFDPRIPRYQQTPPNWGVGVSGSAQGVGNKTTFPGGAATPDIRGISISGEYQPPGLQRYGVFGFGPSVNLYPSFQSNSVTGGKFSIYSFGAQFRYQARFFREQPIVPTAGFAAEYWQYKLADGTKGAFNATGPFFGGMLLLNTLDSGGAAAFHSNYGVLRSYLVAELRMLSGTQAGLQISGSALFFGLRIEF